jgi:hypothetical protein
MLSLVAAAPAIAEPDVHVDTRCFQFARQPARLVQLRQLVTGDFANRAAFVRYAGSKTWIPLVLSKLASLPMAPGSDKEEVDTDWLEIARGGVTGRYRLGTFGAEIVFFEYVDGASGRKTEFELAPMPRGVDPCETKSN